MHRMWNADLRTPRRSPLIPGGTAKILEHLPFHETHRAQSQANRTRRLGDCLVVILCEERWRYRPDSNRCTRICNPVRSLSATVPPLISPEASTKDIAEQTICARSNFNAAIQSQSPCGYMIDEPSAPQLLGASREILRIHCGVVGRSQSSHQNACWSSSSY